MALKFNCPVCNFELVVQYLNPGETANCRECGSFVTVPDDAGFVESSGSILGADKTPIHNQSQADEYKVIPRFRDALCFAWGVIKKNYDLSIGVAVILLLGGVANSITNMFFYNKLGKGIFIMLAGQLLTGIIGVILRVGALKIALGFVFNQSAKPADFRATFIQYWRCYIGQFIFFLMIILGLLVFIIPGLILAVRYQYYEILILRYNMGIVESFKQSALLTKQYRWELFEFNIVAILFGLIGFLGFCVGGYITFPIATVAWTYVFKCLIDHKGIEKKGVPEQFPSDSNNKIIENIESPRYYPTILQAIMLLLIYVALEVVFIFPFGILEGITEITLLDFTPIEITISIFIFILLVWFIKKKTGRSLIDLASIGKINPWLLLPITITFIGIGITASEIDNILSVFLPKAGWYLEIMNELRSNLFDYIALAIIYAPITEEFIFRGIIVRGFTQNYSVKRAILFSALLFGIVHLNPWQFVGAFYGGIILAWIYIETKSVLPCIYAHTLYNGFDLIIYRIFHFEIPGFTVPNHSENAFQPWWFDLTGVILFAGGIWWLYNMFKRKKVDEALKHDQITGGF